MEYRRKRQFYAHCQCWLTLLVDFDVFRVVGKMSKNFSHFTSHSQEIGHPFGDDLGCSFESVSVYASTEVMLAACAEHCVGRSCMLHLRVKRVMSIENNKDKLNCSNCLGSEMMWLLYYFIENSIESMKLHLLNA